MDGRKTVAKIVESISSQLAKVRIEGLGQEFLLRREELDTFQHLAHEDSNIRFLPYEDPYTKGFKLKQRLTDHDFERIAYPMGNALPIVLAGGRIVGTWSITIADQVLRLLIRKLVPLDRVTTGKVREEGQRLGRFLKREMPTEVTIAHDKRWRQIIANSRPSYYATGTPRQNR